MPAPIDPTTGQPYGADAPSAGGQSNVLWPDNSTPVAPEFGKQTSIVQFTPGNVPKGAVGQDVTALGGKPSGRTYIDGDQWAPRMKSAAEITALQLRMIAAGLLDRAKIHPGIWDVESAQAYALVLAQANTYGATGADMLDALQQHAQTDKAKIQNLQFTNPEDLRTGLANVAPNLVGGELPKGEQDAYLTYYKQQEQNNYDAQAAGTPYTSPMGPESYIRQQDPQQVDAYNSASRLIEWYRMLGVI